MMLVFSFFYSFFNLFAGFLIPVPAMPWWWRWNAYLDPVQWTLYGLVASQLGDVHDGCVRAAPDAPCASPPAHFLRARPLRLPPRLPGRRRRHPRGVLRRLRRSRGARAHAALSVKPSPSKQACTYMCRKCRYCALALALLARIDSPKHARCAVHRPGRHVRPHCAERALLRL